MKRGEIWTVSGGGDFAGKPRPAVIIQDDSFAATGSVSICAFTSDPTDAPLFRVAVAPGPENGLKTESRLMADKLTTVSRDRLGNKIGELPAADMKRLERAIMVFLGLAR
ncbi:MAG: type II toxin-antitoxin system PemK/MazF family toxin [Rhizobiales bacterium]|nr:type II toxin-antitoxin system PemK/MazF family toxin [Hyphomicrobiales bacterium]